MDIKSYFYEKDMISIIKWEDISSSLFNIFVPKLRHSPISSLLPTFLARSTQCTLFFPHKNPSLDPMSSVSYCLTSFLPFQQNSEKRCLTFLNSLSRHSNETGFVINPNRTAMPACDCTTPKVLLEHQQHFTQPTTSLCLRHVHH